MNLAGLPDREIRIGVEHDLCLWRHQERVDFRTLIGHVASGIRPLDPGDPRARRLPSGMALTAADGWQAELATPPIPVGPGVPQHIDDLLRGERTELRDLAAAHGVTHVSGCSTRLNISVPDETVVGIGLMLVESCVAALATVIEPTTSPGLLVRPRRGRLQIGGAYVEGADLVTGLTLLAGCVRGLLEGDFPATSSAPEVWPSQERYGWFVAPMAAREDLDALAAIWDWARGWAEVQGLDPAPVDELVSGSRARRQADAAAAPCTFGEPASTSPAHRTRPRELSHGIRAETEWLTWQYVVWLVRDAQGRQCRAVLPIHQEEAFLDQLDRGLLDAALHRMLSRRAPLRRLVVHAQIGEAILWHDVRPGALVPTERLPDGRVPRVSKRRARRDHLRGRRAEAR